MSSLLIDIDECKSYSTEAGLTRALARLGLDDYDGCRYMLVRNRLGRWTAIFLITEWSRTRGGYIAFASQHGFMSV